jgi:hypothetical protein
MVSGLISLRVSSPPVRLLDIEDELGKLATHLLPNLLEQMRNRSQSQPTLRDPCHGSIERDERVSAQERNLHEAHLDIECDQPVAGVRHPHKDLQVRVTGRVLAYGLDSYSGTAKLPFHRVSHGITRETACSNQGRKREHLHTEAVQIPQARSVVELLHYALVCRL